MTPEKADRRVRRTRRVLQQALQELIVERGYASVTVQDILDRADVGRSTFYAHFRDKEDLLISGFEFLHAEVEASLAVTDGDVPSISDTMLALFRHAEANRLAFRALMGGGSGEVMIRHARRYLKGRLGGQLAGSGIRPLDATTRDALEEFVVSTMLAMTSWWLDNDLPLPADEMHSLLMALMMPGVERALAGRAPSV